MIDASHWKLRGRVRTLRSDIAEWDAAALDWQPPRFFQSVMFDRDGRVVQLDQRGAEGSVFRTTYHYDANGRISETEAGTVGADRVYRVVHIYDVAGRPLSIRGTGDDGIERVTHTSTFDERGCRTTIHVLPPAVQRCDTFGIDGSDISYGAPGAATITTSYDERDRAREVVFQDASSAIVRRITLAPDGEGRVVTEEAQNVAPFPLPDSPLRISADDLVQMQAMMSQVFGTIRTTYQYDDEGLLLFRTQQMGQLGEERISYRYDDRGNPLEESHESVNREMHFDADGPVGSGETTRVHDVRFSYRYDAEGNWTTRIVASRFARDAPFVPSNTELRTIEYYGES